MHTHETVIRLEHVDAAGLLYFARIFPIAHQCYEEFLQLHMPIDSIIDSSDFLVPIVHAQADYKKPIRLTDKLTIEMTVEKEGTTSFQLNYNFLDDANSIAVNVQTTHVVIDKATGKSKPLPDSVKKVLDALK